MVQGGGDMRFQNKGKLLRLEDSYGNGFPNSARAVAADFCPEGAVTYQPGATPWVARQHGGRSPEGAKQRRNRCRVATLSRPYRQRREGLFLGEIGVFRIERI
jgi:hypothetical protein